MTIVPNSPYEPTVSTDTKFVDFCRDVQKSQVDVEMFSENRAKFPHITLYKVFLFLATVVELRRIDLAS